MLLYERDFLWRNMSFEKYIRSHQGGFFMGKIFGTRFKMIVFDIWKYLYHSLFYYLIFYNYDGNYKFMNAFTITGFESLTPSRISTRMRISRSKQSSFRSRSRSYEICKIRILMNKNCKSCFPSNSVVVNSLCLFPHFLYTGRDFLPYYTFAYVFT